MNEHIYIQTFQQKLIGLFESKAQEFTKYSEEDALSAPVAAQLAGLYTELAEVMRS